MMKVTDKTINIRRTYAAEYCGLSANTFMLLESWGMGPIKLNPSVKWGRDVYYPRKLLDKWKDDLTFDFEPTGDQIVDVINMFGSRFDRPRTDGQALHYTSHEIDIFETFRLYWGLIEMMRRDRAYRKHCKGHRYVNNYEYRKIYGSTLEWE